MKAFGLTDVETSQITTGQTTMMDVLAGMVAKKKLTPEGAKALNRKLSELQNTRDMGLQELISGGDPYKHLSGGAIPDRPPTPGEQEGIWDLTDKPLPPLGPLDIGKKRRIKFRSKEGDIQTWDVIGETDKEGKRFWKVQRRLWE